MTSLRRFSKLKILLIILVTNFSLLIPYPISIVTSLFWVFLSGYLIYSILFEKEKLSIFTGLKIFSLSISFTFFLFPVFALPFMFIKLSSLWFLAIIFLDVMFCIYIYSILKRKSVKITTLYQNSDHDFTHVSVLLILVLVFILSIYANHQVFFSKHPYYMLSDQMIYLQTINAFRFGVYPPPNLFYAGTINTNYYANLPSFIVYATTFEITQPPSVKEILYFIFLQNSLVTIAYLLLAYLITFEFTNSKLAGIITVIFLGFGTDILGTVSYLYNMELPEYLGVVTPYMFNKNIFFLHVPSLAFDVLFKGFEKSPALIITLLFIYILKRYTENRERRTLVTLFLFSNPILPLFHLGILSPFYVAVGIYAIMIILRKFLRYLRLYPRNNKEQKILAYYLFLLIFLIGIILFTLFYFNADLAKYLSSLLYFRLLPINITLRSLLLYLGPSLILSIIGLISLLKLNILKTCIFLQFLIIWFVSAMVFVICFDLYTPDGAIANYFTYDNVTIPTAILAGIGSFQLLNMYVYRSKLAYILNLFLIFLMVSSVFPSSLSWYMTDYSELYTKLSPRYDLRLSEDDIDAYNYILSHTPKNSIFLTSPKNWLIASLTGRAIVMESGYAVLNERNQDIIQIFTSEDLRETVKLLNKYKVNYIYISTQEINEYGKGLDKFFHFPEVFKPIYNKNGITIFLVNYDAINGVGSVNLTTIIVKYSYELA
jgi:hypothetical protein